MIRARQQPALAMAIMLVAGSTGCGAGTGSATGPASGHRPGGPVAPLRGPARDLFRGSIISGRGAYAGFTGRADILLGPHGAGLRRSVTVTLAGRPCAGGSHCLVLSGTLTGKLTPRPGGNPDFGRGYLLSAGGDLHPIGQVTTKGDVQGTGFIARGRETLTLTLTGASGSVTLQAMSGLVRGFTAP